MQTHSLVAHTVDRILHTCKIILEQNTHPID